MSPRRVTIPSMRHTCAAGLLVMTVVLTGCGASHGEFVMRRVACSGGRSIRMRIPAWKEKHFEGLEREVAEVSTGTLAGGFTLVTVNGYGRDRFAELHLLIPACDLDRRFGKDGTLAVTFPTGLRLSHPRRPEPNGLAFSFAGPSRSGGAFLRGDYEGEAAVGEVTPRGTLDRSFGEGGWVMLPSPSCRDQPECVNGSPGAVLQERSGEIVLDANEPAELAPTSAWVTALSPRGRPDTTFGGHGRVNFYIGPVWSIATIALEPNGDMLVDDRGGRMGTYSIELGMLSPSGEPVPHFGERIARFWKALGFHAVRFTVGAFREDRASTFSGSVFVQGEGFTLVGMGQRESLERLYKPNVRPPRDPGVIAHFKSDGELVGRPVRFHSEMLWSVSAHPEGHHIVLGGMSWANPNRLTRMALEPDGQPDPRFANQGRRQKKP